MGNRTVLDLSSNPGLSSIWYLCLSCLDFLLVKWHILMAIWRVFLISQKTQQHDIELSFLFCTRDHAILVQQWERSPGNCQPKAIAVLSYLEWNRKLGLLMPNGIRVHWALVEGNYIVERRSGKWWCRMSNWPGIYCLAGGFGLSALCHCHRNTGSHFKGNQEEILRQDVQNRYQLQWGGLDHPKGRK